MNRLDGLTVHDLRVMATLGDLLHFGRTAEALGVAQPTVSAAVQKFESTVGAMVFFRTSRRCEITPAGAELLRQVKAALASLSAIETEDEELSGTLRLGLIPTIAPYVLPLVLAPVREAFPRLSIYFTEGLTSRVLEELYEHKLDAALVSSFGERAGIDRFEVMRERFVLALPAQHPWAVLREIPAENLKPEEMLLLDQGNCLRDQTLRLCGGEGDGVSHTTSLPTLLYLVSSGLGYAVIPEMARCVAEGIPGVVVRELETAQEREVLLACRSGDRRRQHFVRLAEVLRSALE